MGFSCGLSRYRRVALGSWDAIGPVLGNGLEHVRRETPEPIGHRLRVVCRADERGSECPLSDMDAELAIRFELLLIVELIERRLMRKIGVESLISLEQLSLVSPSETASCRA